MAGGIKGIVHFFNHSMMMGKIMRVDGRHKKDVVLRKILNNNTTFDYDEITFPAYNGTTYHYKKIDGIWKEVDYV
jgi:hypothetical protein